METAITYLIYFVIAIVSFEIIFGVVVLCFFILIFGSAGTAAVLALFKNSKQIK